VQDVFRGEPGRLDDAVFYLCGMKKMVADVHALLAELGIDRARSFLNY
jgi:ferredoxin-NADP reductase